MDCAELEVLHPKTFGLQREVKLRRSICTLKDLRPIYILRNTRVDAYTQDLSQDERFMYDQALAYIFTGAHIQGLCGDE